MNFSKKRILSCLITILIIAATVTAFWPVLQNDFVDWDDNANLTVNEKYRGLGWAQLRWMFTTFWVGHYQPLSWVTFGLDYLIWGMDPFGYHLTNLLLHAVNAVLFYFIALRLLSWTPSEFADDHSLQLGAGLAALVFAIHPLRVESVAWVTERRDVLSGVFFLLTVLCYLRATGQKAEKYTKWMMMAVGAYVLSLLSKAVGMTLPVVLLILDVYPLKRLEGSPARWFTPAHRNVWVEKIPFIVLAVGAAVVAAIAQTGALRPFARHGVMARVAQASFGLIHYLRKSLLPVALSPMYELQRNFNPFDWAYVASGLLVVGMSVVLYYLRNRWPAGLAVWVYYVVLIAPVSGIAQAGPQLVADRYSYLSCLGWAVLAGGGGVYTWRRWLSQRRVRLVLGAAVVVLLMSTLGALTWKQTHVWHDSETLFTYVLRVTPDSRIAHNNLGGILANGGQLDEAIKHFHRAIELGLNYEEAHSNLAEALSRQGKIDEALEHYRKALKINPAFAQARHGLGLLLVKQGNIDEAIEHYRQAIQSDPSFVEGHNNLGRLLITRGKVDEAIVYLRKSLELEPKFTLAQLNLGDALVGKGQVEEAIIHYRRALELDPKLASARLGLGNALASRGKVDESMDQYREALEIDPKLAAAHARLADALFARGAVDDSISHYRSALKIDNGMDTVHYNLGNALMRKGRLDEAIDHYRRALKANPKFADAYYNLGNAYFKRAEIVKDAIWYGDAIDQYQLAIKLNPKYVAAYYNYGNAAMKVGDYETAVEQYQKALEYDPKSAQILTNQAAALASLGYLHDAVVRYQFALKLNPRFAEAHYNWGNLLLNKGDLDGAIERYRRAIEINPKYVEAYTNLASALKAQGDKEGALKNYEKALKVDPRYAAAHFNLGLLKTEMDEVESALEHFRRAAEINPRDADAYFYRGKLLMAQGRLDEASLQFSQAVRIAPDFGAAKQSLVQVQALQRTKDEKTDRRPEENLTITP